MNARDRAWRLGTLAAEAGRGLAGACPYDANGDSEEKALAMVFVRGYVAAGGTVDGLHYGDEDQPEEVEFRGRTYRRVTGR